MGQILGTWSYSYLWAAMRVLGLEHRKKSSCYELLIWLSSSCTQLSVDYSGFSVIYLNIFFIYFGYYHSIRYSVGKIFPHSVGCCFVWMALSFALIFFLQKLFSFIRFLFINCWFSSLDNSVLFIQSFSVPNSSRLFPTFSSI